MTLVKHVLKDRVKLLVTTLETKEQIQELYDALSDTQFYELHFINIKVLPASIIPRLHELKGKITLSIEDVKLRYYLLELGFKLKYKELHTKTLNNIEDIKCIGLGGSAGSLEKFIDILKELPKSDMSLFIIMHQRSDAKSSLVQILSRCTNYYRVKEAVSDEKIAPRTIYVAPPAKHMIVTGGYIFLTDDEPKHFSKPSISTSFESLALEYREQLLCILVCGYGSDGSDSLKEIRKNGGCVIIEQLHECEATPMLENAIYSKEYDYILSIDAISKFIHEKVSKIKDIDAQIDSFLLDVYNVYGYDYRHYDREHVKRRIQHFYALLGSNSFSHFRESVLHDKDIFKDLFLNLSVNVTTFFRNPQTFKILKEEILPKFKNRSSIKIWCAGSSSGEEPYSIAILLNELGLLHKSLIYATDINAVILQQAKNGMYSQKSFQRFLQHCEDSSASFDFAHYFEDFKDFVMIKEFIKEKILFFRHNLVSDGVLNEFQLVFCRNVIIYFDEELKHRVFNLFDDSLSQDGVLVLGESEAYDNRENFEPLDTSNKIYGKKS